MPSPRRSQDVFVHVRAAARTVLIAIVWILWIPSVALVKCFSWTWHFLRARPWRLMAGMAIVCGLVFAGIEFVPIFYGRCALVYEAAFLARTSSFRTPEEIQNQLIHEAFRLGFTDAATQSQPFTIENTTSDDGLLLCKVSIDLTQRVHLLGTIGFPIRIRADVTKAVDVDRERPKRVEDWIFG